MWSRQHNIGFSVCHNLPGCIVSGKVFHAAVVSLVDAFLSPLDAAVFTLAFPIGSVKIYAQIYLQAPAE